MTKADLIKMQQEIINKQKILSDELIKLYPYGSRVQVRLKHGQHNPSWGTVLCASYRGESLTVRITEKCVRSIGLEDILS